MTCNCAECDKKEECKETNKKGAKLSVELIPTEGSIGAAKVKIEGTTANLINAVGSAVTAISQSTNIPAPVLLAKVVDFCFEQEREELQETDKGAVAKSLLDTFKSLNNVLSEAIRGGKN